MKQCTHSQILDRSSASDRRVVHRGTGRPVRCRICQHPWTDEHEAGGDVRRAWVRVLLIGALAFTAGLATAHDGTPQPGWGDDGRLLLDVADGLQTAPVSVAREPDGRIMLAGTCRLYLPDTSVSRTPCLTRRLVDGDADAGFGTGGNGHVLLGEQAAYPAGVTLSQHGLARLPDGRWLVAGNVGSQALLAVVDSTGGLQSIGPDGEPYLSIAFNPEASPPKHDEINAVEVDSMGRVVLVGASRADVTGSASPRFRYGIARLNADLSLDAGFAEGGRRLIHPLSAESTLDSRATAVAVSADALLVAGRTDSGAVVLAKLDDVGALDPGFGSDGLSLVSKMAISVNAIVLDAAGRPLILEVAPLGTAVWGSWVRRFQMDGTIDKTFGGMGAAPVGGAVGPGLHVVQGYSLTLQSDGRILAAGSTLREAIREASSLFVTRLNENGQRDVSFGSNGDFWGTFLSDNNGDAMAHGITVDGFGILVAGLAGLGSEPVPRQFGLLLLQLDPIFADGFE